MSPDGNWRVKPNPLAWGSAEPKIIVLGFSKGPKQVAKLEKAGHDETAFNEVAFKDSRDYVGKILAHVGAVPIPKNDDFEGLIDQLIADKNGSYHFASLVRCSVSYRCKKTNKWKAAGGRILDKFMDSEFADEVAGNCVKRFLKSLPKRTRLVILFGLGTKQNYVSSVKKLINEARGGNLQDVNKVAYKDESVTFVHVEHFTAHSHISDWLGETGDERAELGYRAREAVQDALKD